MKVAYIITRSDEVGGAHIHVRDLAQWMQLQGHEVCVFVGSSGPFTDLLKSKGITFCSLKYLKRPISLINDWRSVAELVRCIGEYQPDLVSLHSAKAGLLGRIACARLNASVIFTAHGWSFSEGVSQPSRVVYRLLERWFAHKADRIITVCEADRQYALSLKVGKSTHMIAVNNGMPDIPIKLLANPVNIPAQIVMVARFEKQKDHVTLIEALGKLKDLQWKLSLVGEGPLLEDIQSMVKELSLHNRVEFMGRRNDIPEILSKSDIFVLVSFWEGFPRSILEAMRASLPVVATSVAGVPEAVVNDITGFLVEPGSSNQIRDKLRLLIENAELRKILGENGRTKYEEKFTFERMARRTFEVYESVIFDKS